MINDHRFITDLEHPATKFDRNDPCLICGYRSRDHQEPKIMTSDEYERLTEELINYEIYSQPEMRLDELKKLFDEVEKENNDNNQI
ncbi:MAG TPA: hypothetical protein VGE97_01200 [Nitrososphaera sp.]|jgi:hypothetical protein